MGLSISSLGGVSSHWYPDLPLDFFGLPMDFCPPVRVALGALVFLLAGAAMPASGQAPSMEEITRTALSNYAEAAQLFYLEERCPALTAQERGEYLRFLSTASSVLQVAALGAYQAAQANEYAIGSRLVPDRFRDCAATGVAEAIRSGYSKARMAAVLINQIPQGYRLPAVSVQQAPTVTENPQSARPVRLVQHPSDLWVWIDLNSINTRAGVSYYSTAISMRGGVSPEAEGYRSGPLQETNGINCATGERISYDTMYDRWESSGATSAALRSLICGR